MPEDCGWGQSCVWVPGCYGGAPKGYDWGARRLLLGARGLWLESELCVGARALWRGAEGL